LKQFPEKRLEVGEHIQIEETISPVALKTISDWIAKHTTTQK
jgi:hypothetical protein